MMGIDWPEVQIAYVNVGGIATLPVEGDAVTCRVALGFLGDPDSGLISEVESERWPVPWVNVRVREQAIVAIENRHDLKQKMRDTLVAHILKTPWYSED